MVSMLDTDLYKITMQQAVCQLYPNEFVRYEFFNRDDRPFPENFDKILKDRIDAMADLKLNTKEKVFLKEKCPFLNPVYLDFLDGYRFNPDEIHIQQTGHKLKITIEGYWYRTILWEVPLMALISELYFIETGRGITPEFRDWGKPINDAKVEKFQRLGVRPADFGTRRRHSFRNHCWVLNDLRDILIGTSNVFLAKELNLKPIGTQAHEWFSLHAAKYGFNIANEVALEKWVEVYQGNLGIALTDTFTSDNFFSVFNTKYAKLFDGIRHDSADPIIFAEKAIKHYEKLKIDPKSKTIVFSDGLNYDAVEKIENYCRGKIKTSYGIGTWLTNDLPGIKPLNIVIKLTGWFHNDKWIPTIKLSDNPGKHTGDPEMINLCKQTIRV